MGTSLLSIKNQLIISGLFLVLGVVFPILSLTTNLMPDGETVATWFQRSGSVMVVFSVMSEFRLLALATTINPGEHVLELGSSAQVEIYKIPHFVLSVISLTLVIAGTVIWGYGDVLLKFA